VDTQELLDSMGQALDQIEAIAREGRKAFMNSVDVHADDATVQLIAGFLGVTLTTVTKLTQCVIQMTQHNVESFADLNRKIDGLGVASGGTGA